MKAKKTKTQREEQTTHHSSNAFSYLRNRLFHGTTTSSSSSSSNQTFQQPSLPSKNETCQDAPSRITGHSRSSSHRSSPSVDLAQLSNAWRSGSTTTGRPVSRSFEETQYSMDNNNQLTTPEVTTTSFARPISVMGLLARNHDSNSAGRRAGEGKSESKRTSLIVIKEGFLYKKADFRAFHKASKLDRSWKPYRVVLRGHKLYLYKISSESAFKALFPSSQQQQHHDLPSSPSSSSIASSIIKSVGDIITDPVELSVMNMDQLGERDEYLYGAIFNEIKSAGESQYVALLLYKHEVVICLRTSYQQQWKIDSKIPIHQVQLEQRVMDPQASSSFALLYKDELRIFTTHASDVQTSWIDALMKAKELSCAGDKKRESTLYKGVGPHPDLHMGDQIVQGGTIEALVHELIYQQCTQTMSDTFLRSFLLTYNMFTTSAVVLETMKSYLQQTMDDGDTQVMHNIFERVLDVFTIWCDLFTQDVVGDVVAGMISILDELEGALVDTPVLLDKTKITRKFILATVNRNGEAGEQANVESAASWDDAVESIQASQLERSSINLSNLLITGLTPGLFLSIHPQRFAEQLYMFHLTQHRLHKDALISLLTYVPRPHISAQILNSVVFTAASPHFIAKLIRHHILIDSQHHRQDGMEGNVIEENSTLLRTQLLEHWIRVGSALLDLGDMTGWCAVASAICSLGVIRLKESWKSVDRALVEMVTQDWVNRLMEYGFFTQEIWISGWEHSPILDKFTRVMDAPQQSNNDLAFFGPIRQSVDRLRKHIKDCYPEGGVNFSKYWMIYQAIQSSLDHWKRTMKPLSNNEYPFQVVGPLQAFFDHSVTTFISVPHDFKYLHECSLGCEPRIFGQSFDRHRKFDSLHGTNVAPPSSSTLTFPEVLEGYRLFQPAEHLQHDTSSSPRTNLRKKSSSHSVKSDSGEHGSSVTLPRTPTSLVSMSTSSTVATRPPAPSHGFSYDQSRQHKLPRVTRRKLFRRRTYSFPPGRVVGDTATRFMQSDDGATMDSSYLDSLHSRTWLGSLVSQKHGTSTAKALVEAIQHREKSSGEWLIVAENGNLILKASTLLQSDDSVTKKSPSPSLKKSTSSGFLALAEKGSSGMRSRSGTLSSDAPRKEEDILLWGDNQQQEGQSVLVNVKAGLLEYLVDTLVHGVSAYNKDMREQWQLPSLLNGNLEETPRYLTIDDEEYTSAFFVTYRSFCSCVQLLDLMRKKFTGALAASRQARQETRNALETVFKADDQDFDWRFVASTQLRVNQLMLYWSEEHFYDFVDEIEILGHFSRFLEQSQAAIDEWTTPLRQQQQQQQDYSSQEYKDIQAALSVAHAIHRQLNDLRQQFIQKILSPCYDLKAISYDTTCSRKVDDLYTQLTTGMQRFSVAVTQNSRQSQAFSLISKPLEELGKETLSDQQSAWTLLEQTDRCVHQLFASVTLQDWIQTFDIFEAQSSDLYAWLPAHKASQTPPLSSSLSSVRDCPTAQPNSYHIAAEDVMVSDIFTAIEGARRSIVSPSAFSADDLLLAFPSSIQYLYCMHFIIRSLVIHETTAMDIDLATRVQRIHKFLQMLMISKGVTEQMVLFPELRDVDDRPRRVPGFVEYAIASALISPEVRVFTKAWSQVMRHYGLTQLDTLENLLSHIQQRNKVDDMYDEESSSNTMRLVPSVGWIFDRMLELCAAVPDTYNRQQHMINFDKRRYVFHFLQLVMNSQMDLEEAGNNDASSSLAFIISPNQKKPTWKELKDMAHRENRTGGGLSSRAGSKGHYTRTTVFNKLVAEQLDKLKRDIKERDRIDKEWRDLQHKLQKRQLEQQRYLEKQERRNQQKQGHHHLPKFNAFFRTRKAAGGYADSVSDTTMDASDVLATAKASTVINLIHATTSVASAYTRRDHVFRIVTEEGGQYLFQGTSRDEMHDWMLQINNAAHAGAVKRRSVLAAESEDNRNSSGTTATHHLTECDTPTSHTRRSVYGMDLSTLMADGNVPMIAEKCINEIEKRGLEEVGIYRMAGTGSIVEQLKTAFNRDMATVNLGDPDWADVNVIADAFKQFLRSIPGSLLTHTYYDEFIHASASEDHDQRVYLIKQVLKKLPEPNYILLKRLIQHFVIVTDFEAVNHMYATNLAIVFGPTLLQPAPGPASFATTMSNLGHHQTIVKYLILHYHYLFDVESDEMEQEEGNEEQHGEISSTTTTSQQYNEGDDDDDGGSKISTASNIRRD
ncbi:hypothetical protein K492DRAFT_205374 [Lichtheimia hyalospora FSU 10163]|nr:hypothetical protein K492DRAFT_205374 [Lichtheimia hyalospora FSU 10163]